MRNISAKADGVGDTLPADDFNANLRSELQNVVTSVGFTLDPEGGPDTDVEMLGKAIAIYGNACQFYQDSGAANAYVLARVGTLKPLAAYVDGVIVVFKAGNENTGASTVNVDSLGAKAIRSNLDVALVGGEITANGYVIARYRSSTDRFEILYSQSISAVPLPSSADAYQSIQVKSDGTGYELAGPLVNFRNKIINGNFELWDYATSQTGSGYGSDNRWDNSHSGSTKTHSRQSFTVGQTDVPGNPEYYSRTVVTTGGGASDYVRKTQPIEYVKTFSGGSLSLSFWAKADSSKDIAVEFYQYFGSGGTPSASVDSIGVTTINLTSSWVKHSVVVSVPSISGKTLGTGSNDYVSMNFWFDAGSDRNARTNSLGNQSGTFDIARVQVEAGPVETEFEDRFIGTERSLAERFNLRLAADVDRLPFAAGRIQTASASSYAFLFPTPMRVPPTVTVSDVGGFDLGDGGGTQTSTGISSGDTTTKGTDLNCTTAAFSNVGGGTTIRIQINDWVNFSAEL